MQKALKSHHYPKKQDNPSKWTFLLLIKISGNLNLDFVTLDESCIFGFLSINTSLKLYYKNMHTLAHGEGGGLSKISVIDYIL